MASLPLPAVVGIATNGGPARSIVPVPVAISSGVASFTLHIRKSFAISITVPPPTAIIISGLTFLHSLTPRSMSGKSG